MEQWSGAGGGCGDDCDYEHNVVMFFCIL